MRSGGNEDEQAQELVTAKCEFKSSPLPLLNRRGPRNPMEHCTSLALRGSHRCVAVESAGRPAPAGITHFARPSRSPRPFVVILESRGPLHPTVGVHKNGRRDGRRFSSARWGRWDREGCQPAHVRATAANPRERACGSFCGRTLGLDASHPDGRISRGDRSRGDGFYTVSGMANVTGRN